MILAYLLPTVASIYDIWKLFTGDKHFDWSSAFTYLMALLVYGTLIWTLLSGSTSNVLMAPTRHALKPASEAVRDILAKHEKEERHLKLSIEDYDTDGEIGINEGLYGGRTYRMLLDLSVLRDLRLKGEAEPFYKREGESLELQVAVVPRSSVVNFLQQTAILRWDTDGATAPASFVFEVETGASGTVEIDVFVHRDCDLALAATIEAEVAPAGRGWTSSVPVRWEAVPSTGDRRSRPFQRLSPLLEQGSRTVCIAVQPTHNPDEYLLTVLTRRAELPLRVKFSRAELGGQLFVNMRGLRADPFVEAQ